ncbi:MAG: isoamylase early set domain-containing protein [Planctomycetes bacterium]|jgi:1,4-alpha-glucan branching enzyme|nr:isoamylase early set domain-containing protein [Planctomycetota bacterium]
MIRKTPLRGGRSCRVTFSLAADGLERAFLVGDFNEWDKQKTPLVRRKDGQLSASLVLPTGKSYRFRYFLGGDRWRNDEAPDALAANPFGTQDGVLAL